MYVESTASHTNSMRCMCQPAPCCYSNNNRPLSIFKPASIRPAALDRLFHRFSSAQNPFHFLYASSSSSHRRSTETPQLPEQRGAVVTSAAAAGHFADGSDEQHLWHYTHALSQQLREFVSAQYLPVALVCALILGAVNPSLGLAASKMHIPALATFGIFMVQGLQLKRKEAMAALTAKREIAYGLVSILLITPLLGLLVAQLPLNPRPLAFGLGVVCAVPTALACGVAFVQQLGGNVSLALLLTVTTNILGIFTMPFILPHMARAAALTTLAAAAAAAAGPSAAATVTLEPLPLMLQLCQTILVPTMLGASIRCLVPGAAAAIDRNKKILSYINAGLLASVPWMQISKTASQRMGVDSLAIVSMIAAAVGLHIVLLSTNTLACRLLQLGGPDPVAARPIRRALIISGSVKTLPVAVTVLTQLGPVLGEASVGIAMLPVVAYQLTQIMWESVMVSRWLAADKLAMDH